MQNVIESAPSSGECSSSDNPVVRLILKNLRAVQERTSGYSAQCPLCDDEDFSVTGGLQGEIFLFCRHGCDYKEILKKVGLTETELRNAPPFWTAHTPERRDISPYISDRRFSNDRLGETAKLQTDVGNAARYAIQHGDDLQFCHSRGDHLIYDRNRWKWSDAGKPISMAKDTALNIYSESQAASRDAKVAQARGDEDAAEKHAARAAELAKWAHSSQKRERISAMIELAKPDLSILPDRLDSDPWLLNCKNGTIDLRTGDMRGHRREDFITRVANANYDKSATSPTFDAFLQRIFRSNPALIPFIQRAIGYASTGSVREQCLFFLHGKGANGKTTLIDAVQYALADYAGKADPDLLMMRDGSSAHPTNVADLMGRRTVVCSETADGRRFDESKLKDLAGETRLKARFLYGDFFEFNATHKIFMYSNHKPVVRGTDYGFWRRMKLIPFLETIGENERDPDLLEKLKAEAGGILKWIVDGAIAWYREGLGTPPEVVKATNEYRTEMDSIGAFIKDSCVEGDRLVSSAKDLYEAYCKWCNENGEHPLSQKRLGQALGERNYISDRGGAGGRKTWRGIGLKQLTPGE